MRRSQINPVLYHIFQEGLQDPIYTYNAGYPEVFEPKQVYLRALGAEKVLKPGFVRKDGTVCPSYDEQLKAIRPDLSFKTDGSVDGYYHKREHTPFYA